MQVESEDHYNDYNFLLLECMQAAQPAVCLGIITTFIFTSRSQDSQEPPPVNQLTQRCFADLRPPLGIQ